jgi:CRISPR type III-A-associated RAMP protein Csm4
MMQRFRASSATEMPEGYIVRLLPSGPWRIGPDGGAANRTDDIYHSDSLYAAVCSAMLGLGALEEWLDATVGGDSPAVRFSSAFPWMDSHFYVRPPRTHWPQPGASRLRSAGARFIPLSVVRELLDGRSLEEDRWEIDGASGCLAPRHRRAGQGGPFRYSVRGGAAVDRLSGGGISLPHRAGCLEFAPNAGFWFAVEFAGKEAEAAWWPRLQTALRWLADSGFGGKRSLGWGHCEIVEIRRATLGEILAEPLPEAAGRPAFPAPEAVTGAGAGEEPAGDIPMDNGAGAAATSHSETSDGQEPPAQGLAEAGASEAGAEPAPVPETPPAPGLQTYWLLSLYNPAPSDEIDWTRGCYSFRARGGRIESSAGWGREKRQLRMVEEGSVLFSSRAPAGRAVDVAPPGHPHPVYRAGFALAIPVPWRVNA